MATIRYEGNEVELAEDWRIGELIEAENTLGIDMESARGAARIALVVYISIRRVNAEMPAGILADQVLRMELSGLLEDEDEEKAPLDQVNGDASPAIGARLTTGAPPSDTGST